MAKMQIHVGHTEMDFKCTALLHNKF